MQPGHDIRGKRASESGIPDVVLIDPDGSFNAVIELKNPNEDLADHENQILDYLRELTHQSTSKTTFLLYFPKAGATLGA